MDLEKVCRVCIGREEAKYPINDSIRAQIDVDFDQNEICNLQLLETILRRILQTNDDQLPLFICGNCHEEFRRIYSFMERCIKSLKILGRLKQVKDRVGTLGLRTITIYHRSDKNNQSSTESQNDETQTVASRSEDHSLQISSQLPEIENENKEMINASHFETIATDLPPVMETEIDTESSSYQQYIVKEEFIITEINSEPEDVVEVVEVADENEFVVNTVEVAEENGMVLKKKIKLIEEEPSLIATNSTGLNSFSCNECQIQFPNNYTLVKHRMTKHVHPPVCNTCGKKMMRSKIKKLLCDTCSLNKQNICLLIPKSMFHRDCQYLCMWCGEEYLNKSVFKVHYEKNHAIIGFMED